MEEYFNVSRYKELLELEEKDEISGCDLELLSYEASIEGQIGYNRRQDYFILIHQYLNRIILPHIFRSKFLEMTYEDTDKAEIILQNVKELEVFTLTKDLEKFSDLMGQISTLCFEFGEVWDGSIEVMSESEFYSLLNNYYVQFQEAFPIKNLDSQAYDHLINQSFKGLIISLGLNILFILFNIYIIN